MPPYPPEARQRVLQVLAVLDRGGAEQVVMNWYEVIDRSKVQFDFIVNDRQDEYAHEARIAQLGGRVFRLPKPSIRRPWAYLWAWWKLLRNHPEWSVVHAHHTSTAAVYLTIARLFGRKTIAHSHIAGRDETLKGVAKQFTRFPLRT